MMAFRRNVDKADTFGLFPVQSQKKFVHQPRVAAAVISVRTRLSSRIDAVNVSVIRADFHKIFFHNPVKLGLRPVNLNITINFLAERRHGMCDRYAAFKA